jgi:hypothetical protein
LNIKLKAVRELLDKFEEKSVLLLVLFIFKERVREQARKTSLQLEVIQFTKRGLHLINEFLVVCCQRPVLSEVTFGLLSLFLKTTLVLVELVQVLAGAGCQLDFLTGVQLAEK